MYKIQNTSERLSGLARVTYNKWNYSNYLHVQHENLDKNDARTEKHFHELGHISQNSNTRYIMTILAGRLVILFV